MLRIPYEETEFSEGSSDSRLQRAVLVWVEMCCCGKIVEPGRRFPALLGFRRVPGSHVRVENWVAVAKDLVVDQESSSRICGQVVDAAAQPGLRAVDISQVGSVHRPSRTNRSARVRAQRGCDPRGLPQRRHKLRSIFRISSRGVPSFQVLSNGS